MFDDATTGAYLRMLLGSDARHVPAWMYVQEDGQGGVSFVGASRTGDPHPLRYGSTRTHQMIVGEVVVRPHLVLGTDARRGDGLMSLLLDPFGTDRQMLGPLGEVVVGTDAQARNLIDRHS